MASIEVTIGYAALLGLVFGALSIIVVVIRGKNNMPYGDGGIEILNRAIRAHGNFAEWVPIICLLVAGYEYLGGPARSVHVLMGALVGTRLLHAIGLFSPVGTPLYFFGRITGASLSWLVLCAVSVLVLSQFFYLPAGG
ncbi:MAG: MAPEG family protein [Pseudomonadota bacterium]